MRFRCKRQDLAQAVAVVASAVPARTSVPILQNIKIAAADGELLLTATDLDGKKVYQKEAGPFASQHGYAASPVIWKVYFSKK